MHKIICFLVSLFLVGICTFSITADEGMYPLSEISRLNLKAKGLKIPVKELYNPDGVSLVDAICEVGGGTGEFVSRDGLILTNHHIAFSATAAASTPEHDYVKEGFSAPTHAEEILAKNYSCRITEKYRDVSKEVLGAVKDEMTASDRSKAIRDKMNELAKTEQAERANVQCEVSEMFPGKSYIVFTYRIIKDVRLVYVPPIGVGNFGGESDNWIWPRHTGDFSFLRAYVAPDGSTAEYAEGNVPYTPKKFLKVAPEGVNEGDFVFILGYPGRTFRHKTSHYVKLNEMITLPMVSKRFDYMIRTLEDASKNDRKLQLELADEMKGYANVTKNYKGKLQGLRRLKLVDKKIAEEKELQSFIDRDPKLKARYGSTLSDIGGVYDKYREHAIQELMVMFLGRNKIMRLALALIGNAEAKDRSRESNQKTKDALAKLFDETHFPTEKAFLSNALSETVSLPSKLQFTTRVAPLESSLFANKEKMLQAVDATRADIQVSKDPIIMAAYDLKKISEEIRERQRARDGELKRLEADLLDVKIRWQKKDFIPDANSTLRLTYGYIRGYAPADATFYKPQTTLHGVVEKNSGTGDYDAPQKLLGLYNLKQYNKAFEDKSLDDVPVDMLYNMDTTGGNSGSPIMNARGELVGVNFDRAYEATINDYEWSEEYSRSIGVDIRYVLFIAKYLGGAKYLLKELGVNL